MHGSRFVMLLTAATFATSSIAADPVAQKKDSTVVPPVNLHPATNSDADALAAKLAPSSLGLKPQSALGKAGIDLPYGLNYNRETKSLLMSIDQKNEWGVGVNLDVNSSRSVELAPPTSTLGLQPKRTPGLMLQKKF